MQTIIRTTGLCKRYHGKAAVENLCLEVPQGAIYGFIGQNGAGKSTTFKLLCGLAKPSAGHIELFGAAPDKNAACRLGVLINDTGAYPRLSAAENCRLKAVALALPDPARRVEEVLTQVGLDAVCNKKVKTFSTGQKRRLGLALALLGNPDLLLLDEPTNGLDPQGIRDIRALLLQLQSERGVTMMISSHILGELEKIATDYGILRAGKLVEQTTAADIAARCQDYLEVQTPEAHRAAALLETRLGLHRYEVLSQGQLHLFDLADPAAVNAMLIQGGVPVQGISVHRQALEDYFLKMMGVLQNG